MAAGVTGAGALPGPAAPVTLSALLACTSGSVPVSGGMAPASAASLSGQHECTLESPHSEWRRWRLSSVGRCCLGEKHCRGRFPSPARFSRLARASISFSTASSDAGEQEAVMPPPSSGLLGVGGGRPGPGCSALGCDRSPQPGPSGLGSGLRSSPRAARSCLGFGGRSSLAPSGAAEDNRGSTYDSLDLDWDDSFHAVLCLIREFHSMEEPAGVAPNRCKKSLAPVYGLQSELPPALHLPLFPLLRSP